MKTIWLCIWFTCFYRSVKQNDSCGSPMSQVKAELLYNIKNLRKKVLTYLYT